LNAELKLLLFIFTQPFAGNKKRKCYIDLMFDQIFMIYMNGLGPFALQTAHSSKNIISCQLSFYAPFRGILFAFASLSAFTSGLSHH